MVLTLPGDAGRRIGCDNRYISTPNTDEVGAGTKRLRGGKTLAHLAGVTMWLVKI